MLKIPTKHLLLVNGILWTAIGIKIALTGADGYGRLDGIPWWYFLLSVGHHAQAYPIRPRLLHRLVLLRPGTRSLVGRHPFHHPLVERNAAARLT